MNTATAYAARSTAARKAAQELASQDRPFTRFDEQRAAHLIEYVGRCYSLAHKAAGLDIEGMRATESIFHDRSEARRAWADIRKARRNL